MKRHPLGLMIAIILLQTARSSQQEHIPPLQGVIIPSPASPSETFTDKKDNPAIVRNDESGLHAKYKRASIKYRRRSDGYESRKV